MLLFACFLYMKMKQNTAPLQISRCYLISTHRAEFIFLHIPHPYRFSSQFAIISINPQHYHAALRSQFSLSTSIIIRSVHLSFTRPKALLKITIKVTEGKIRITIRIRLIKIPIGFCRKLILWWLIVWWHLQIDRRSSLTRLILNTNTNKLHLNTKNMVTS